VASSPSESRWEQADAILEAALDLPVERERCVEASRPMVDAALANIVHDLRRGRAGSSDRLAGTLDGHERSA